MKAQDEGTDRMKEIAEYVREGAMAYLRRQYSVVTKVFLILVILLSILAYLGVQNPFVPIAFLTGGFYIVSANNGVPGFVFSILLGRHCTIPGAEDTVRHAGWIASLIFAFLTWNHGNPTMRLAAIVTAFEAMATDLIRWKVLPAITMAAKSNTLFCGNFGIILLHHLWFSDKNGRSSALDVLEKMVQVTMMRGAQSGGVISYHPSGITSIDAKGVRSRVVNKKRTDLSKLLRCRVQRDIFSKRFPKDYVPFLAGHTRFATSSKATMEGTHPHQWTPASHRRVYDFNIPHDDQSNTESRQHKLFLPESTKVENFITHNGDFEFYTVNGKAYDIEVIQKWLVAVTGSPIPAQVDSAAIAGMVDLLRTQGCFGLSARYAVCLGMSTSRMDENLVGFPSYSHFEKIGQIFEEVLAELLTTSTMEAICDSTDTRQLLALRVHTKLKFHSEVLIKPLNHFITDQTVGSSFLTFITDQEEGSSLLSFCLVTVDVS